MSSSIDTRPWFDKYWQLLVIAFGIGFTLVLALYRP